MMLSVQRSFRRSFQLLTGLACLGIVQTSAMAQSSPASLPPAAQEALNKGVIAAKVPDYLLAIRFFEDARKIAPDAPQIYFNLGLAESRIPTRELRAIAWFGAYLAAYPDAPNAAAVKAEIGGLEVRNQSHISGLIRSLQEAAMQNAEPILRYRNLADVAGLWASIGDDAAAFAVIDLIGGEPQNQSANERDNGRGRIASGQMFRGDIPKALKTADLIEDVDGRVRTQVWIAVAEAKTNDIAGALRTINLLQAPQDKASALRDVAVVQMQAGNLSDAIKTLAVARKTVPVTPDPGNRVSLESIAGKLEMIAFTQMEAGDAAGGRDTLTSAVAFALRDVGTISDPEAKRHELWNISKNQAAIGDIVSAQKTLASADIAAHDDHSNSQKSVVLCKIATAQISGGDVAGATQTLELARTTLALIQSAIYRDAYSLNLKSAEAALLDPSQLAWHPPTPVRRQAEIGVSDWVRRLDGTLSDYDLNTGPFLDLAGYLKSLPPSDTPQKTFDRLIAPASRIITAQREVSGMLAQQSKQ